ncbi:MAG: hypothetical protein KKI08_11355, partial [Armatimonadetes bacterium]|nr:hypothetical protein [Armatimonadota bacterium]
MNAPKRRNLLAPMIGLSLAAHLAVLALVPVTGPMARLRQELQQHLTRTTVRFERVVKPPPPPKPAVVKRKPVVRPQRRIVRRVHRVRRTRVVRPRPPTEAPRPDVPEPDVPKPTELALTPPPDKPEAPKVELAPPEPRPAPEPPPPPISEPETPAPMPDRPGLPERSAPQWAATPVEGAVTSVQGTSEEAGPVEEIVPTVSRQAAALPTAPAPTPGET